MESMDLLSEYYERKGDSMENLINQRILALCQEKSWSIYKLAAIAGISVSTLNSILKRNNAPTIPTLQKICEAFDITLSQFFSRDFGEMTSNQSEYMYEFNLLTPHEKEVALAYIKGMNAGKKEALLSEKHSS